MLHCQSVKGDIITVDHQTCRPVGKEPYQITQKNENGPGEKEIER
jgi:hypothetical protein